MHRFLYGALASLLFLTLPGCVSDTGSRDQTFELQTSRPTEGLVTTVREVRQGEWKIEDETVVADPADSRIIAKALDGQVDTFTVDEAKIMSNNPQQYPRHGGMMSTLGMGLMAYYLFARPMGSFRPQRGAYMDQRTYDRSTNTAQQRLQRTASRPATRNTAPRSGNSGYGGSRSTRSVGG